ncbi:hypothetical protein GGR55DRAFT_634194 [Xylaria sp. FL0064]|nr:hypothetical protein GGR55DRAFT_634194 [Xylaria sp. FL0064]
MVESPYVETRSKMDGHSDNTGRIPRLPYELQLGIFCSMTDMDSVRSLTLAYTHCRDVFEQNEKRITDAVHINKTYKAIEELTELRPVSFRLVKWCILLVCYEDRTLRRDSPWIVDYFSNEKLPPDMNQSAVERQFEWLPMLVPPISHCFEAGAHYNATLCLLEKKFGRNIMPNMKPLDDMVGMFLELFYHPFERLEYLFPRLEVLEVVVKRYAIDLTNYRYYEEGYEYARILESKLVIRLRQTRNTSNQAQNKECQEDNTRSHARQRVSQVCNGISQASNQDCQRYDDIA